MNFVNFPEGSQGMESKQIEFSPPCGVYKVHQVPKFLSPGTVATRQRTSAGRRYAYVANGRQNYELRNFMNFDMR